jgi:hypothetical protein
MSAPAVVVPTKGGEAQPAQAVAATPMKGGMVLSPLPLTGGRRKTRRISKKVLKMLKKMSKAKLAKLMKGGQEGEEAAMAPAATTAEEPATGARRTRKGRKGSKRRSGLLY